MTTPIVDALTAIVSAAGRSVLSRSQLAQWQLQSDPDLAIFSYKTANDFKYLWGLDKDTGGLSGIAENLRRHRSVREYTLVIVWDGIPKDESGPVDMARYLTPIDWAVGLSLAIEQARQGQNVPYPATRIRIFDLASHYVSYADSVLFAGLFPKRDITTMPWVRLFRPESTKDREWAATAFVADILDNGPPIPSMRDAARDRPSDLSSIRRIWQGNLIQPAKAEDRHSITNLVGVQLLLEGMGVSATVQDTNTAALVELMRAMGLVPRASDKEPGPWFHPQQWEDLVESFVLLDDIAEQGWASFLVAALGLDDPPSKLRVFTDPMKAINDKDWSINLSEEDVRKDVLFLDLRLFANMGKKEEREFFRNVLNAYDNFKNLPRAKQSWHWLDQQEIVAINRYVEEQAKEETDDYYAALTLLPRLIALFKPWMPILLFSSTGQRHIIDRLQPYKNIIVEFDKPRFFGQATDTVLAETKRRFVRAMERALAIARGRQVCNGILNLPTMARGRKPEPSSHVEIYLDESGSGSDIEVGGIAVIYPDKDTCLNFWQTLRDNNLVWGYHRDDPWNAPQGQCLPKASDFPGQDRRTLIGNTLHKIETLALDKGMTIAACCLGPLKKAPGNLPETVAPDFYFRSLLRYLLEILLCDWLPEYAPNSSVTAWAATRIAPEDSFVNDPQEFIRLQEDFNLGMSIGADKEMRSQIADVQPIGNIQRNWRAVRSDTAFLHDKMNAIRLLNQPSRGYRQVHAYLFSFDSLYPIHLEILGSRSSAPRSGVSALGVQLAYPTSRKTNLLPNQLPRQVHYAADYVISCPNLAPDEWWKRGFRNEAGARFENLVNASRNSDYPERIVDAVIEWSRSRPTTHGVHSCGRFVKRRLQEGVGKIAAEQFIQLCDRLSLEK